MKPDKPQFDFKALVAEQGALSIEKVKTFLPEIQKANQSLSTGPSPSVVDISPALDEGGEEAEIVTKAASSSVAELSEAAVESKGRSLQDEKDRRPHVEMEIGIGVYDVLKAPDDALLKQQGVSVVNIEGDKIDTGSNSQADALVRPLSPRV